MINYKIIYKIIGQLLWLEASLMGLCLLLSFFYEEDDTMPFMLTIVITLIGGFVLKYMGRDANNTLGRRDAYLVVTLTWVIFSLFGMLPFIIGGYLPRVTDAFFETISGFTTTGATIIEDVEVLPHGLLFWRTMTQWIGGLGIVFFTIALLPSLVGGGSVRVFAAETTGPIHSRMHPRLSTNSKWIWLIYIILTGACAVCYFFGGMSFFDCINYAMTTTATGGFATHNSSTEFFGSPAIEYTGTIFCFLSGINFTLLWFSIFKLKFRSILKNTEFKLYCSLIAISTIIIMYYLMRYNHYDLSDAFRYGIFQVVSFVTSTGLFSDDAAKWPRVTWIILGFCMFLGGCAGSTAGGFKCIRGVMLLKIIRNEFKRILHPNAILPVRINDTTINPALRVTLLAYLSVYIILFIIASTYLTAIDIDCVNSITIALSCLGNVGPTLGIEIGPTMSWDMLPDSGKWVCALLMLIGRLEIFSVLILFSPSFWHDN